MQIAFLVKLLTVSKGRSKLGYSYWGQEGFCNESSSGIQLHTKLADLRLCNTTPTYKELHLGDLFIDFLHELNNEIHQLMLEHLFSMGVCDQERNIIALFQSENTPGRPSNGVP